MIKKLNKLTIILFIMLFVIVLPGIVIAGDSLTDEQIKKLYDASDYKSKSELINAGSKAVGKKIWIHNGHDKGVLNQEKSSDEIYCIQHKSDSKSGLYTIDAYVRISGDVANNGSKYIQDKKNLALAYILTKGGYSFGYNANDMTRGWAIHGYLNGNGGWLSSVGSYLGAGGFSHGWSLGSDSKYNKARNLIDEANNYSNNASNKGATISFNKNSYEMNGDNTIGPIKLTFDDTLKTLNLYSKNVRIDNKYVTFLVNGVAKRVSEIKSGDNIIIKLDDSIEDVSRISASCTKSGVLVADMWFCSQGAGQNFLVVDSGTGTNDDYTSASIKKPATGDIKIIKTDSVTKNTITNSTVEAKFKIKTSKGWLSGQNGSYKYNNTEANATQYPTSKGILTLKGLLLGKYTVKEVTPPSRYLISTSTSDIEINLKNLKPEISIPNTPTGDITVTKKDSKTGNIIPEITQFKVYKTGSGWLTDINKYNSDESKAKIYSTSNGKLEIKGLVYGDYTIKEVGAPKGYILAVQPTKSINAKINNSNRDVSKDFTNLRKGSIIIHKIDEEDSSSLEGAGFKVKTPNGWLQGTQAPYKYNASYENATIYRFKNEYSSTDNVIYSSGNGLKIDGLDDGTYHLYEVEAPTGYLLKHQNGYDETKGYVDIEKEITISSNNNIYDINTNITNIKKVSIEGYVWEDTQATKNGTFNSLYDSSRESKIKGVFVRLMKKGDNTPVGTTTTDADGKYLFDSLIKLSELENYYVEFNYNGAVGKKYIPVAFNSSAENGSKAMMNSVAQKDADLSGVATTYTGTSAIDTYGFMKCGTYDEPNLIVRDINLGIKKIPDSDYSLDENIEYVKIDMKGYTYTYQYGSAGNSSSVAAPKVNFQKKGTISGYTADIYPSDIAYEAKNGKEELKVFVGYRIDITNTTTIGIGSAESNYNELYIEKTLNISSLTNKFDTKRYTLSDKDKGNWDAKDGIATMKSNYIADIRNNGIEPNKTATKRIEFKVNRDAILDILNHPYGIIEEYPTKVTTIGYHKYERYDYGWSYNIKTANKQIHITEDDEEEADAPYLIFKLGQERILKGKVFEDKVVTTDGQKLGNGKYDNNENVVKDVKVELLDALGTETDVTKLTVSNLYGVQGNGNSPRTAISKPAQVVTDQNGNYTLNGIVPGRYFLRFTYGDGTQKICDVSGKEIKTIVAKDYKSTIVTNDVAKKALQGKEGEEWYKKITRETDSVAVDDLSVRKNVNEGKTQAAMARTAKISITIENDKIGNSSNVNQKDNGKVQEIENLNTQVENKFEGLSFGIIVMPEQDSEIEKLITNVKLTNSQGNILYNGNPENVPSQGVVALSDLDNKQNGGSTYVRAEMQETSLYGTNIELTYEVKITNKSDVNYYNNEYYWFGDKNINKEVTLTPTLVKDYLDKSLTYVKEKSDKDRIKEINANSKIQVDGENIIAQELDLKGWKAIYTNKITNRDASHPTSDKVKIVAKRILSNNDDDMEIVSRAEIKEIIHTPDPKDSTPQADKIEQVRIAPTEVHTNGMVEAVFTITPPTGENRSVTTIYAIAGIISLIILSTGIVIIKKKVI